MEVSTIQINRDRRTRPKFIVGVGGVEGLLVLGGSLAIAGFMALFTIKTSARRSSKGVDKDIDENKQTISGDDEMEKVGFPLLKYGSSGKKGLEVVLHQQGNDTNGGSNAEESILRLNKANEEENCVVEAAKQDKVEEKTAAAAASDQCQHEILVLSDDSTPPESIVSCDDYTESTDLSLDEEKADEKENYEEEEVEGDLNDDYESSEEDDQEEEEEEETEVTQRSSSLSSLMIEGAAPIHVKEFAEIDSSKYESIAKEQNSFNCLGLEQKLDTSTGMFGSRTHLRPLVGQNQMVSAPQPLTKAQLWLMVLPVVMLTMLLAMIHFFVVDNYVMDMES